MFPRRARLLTAVATLALVAAGLAACSSDDDGDGRVTGARSRASLPAPCNLVSNRVLDDLRAALSSAGVSGGSTAVTASTVELVPGEEQMVGCVIVPDTLVAAVGAYDDGQDPRDIVLAGRTAAERREAGSPEPEAVDGIGDVGFVGRNSADGYRIAAAAGDSVVLVDSRAPADTDPLFPKEVLVDLAQDLAEGAEDLDLATSDLPDTCPDATSTLVTSATGVVRLARGSASPTGVQCSYVGGRGAVDLTVAPADPAAAAVTDGPAAGTAVDVDGDPAFLDDAGHGQLYDDRGCETAVTVSAAPGAERDTAPPESVVVRLLRAGRDDVGCVA